MNRGVTTYLTIAFGLAWAAQIAVAMMARSGESILASPGGSMLITATALMWPPAVGAYVARRWVEHSGFEDAGLRWPAKRYLFVAWLGPPLLALATILLSLPIYPVDTQFSAMTALAEQSGGPLPVPAGVLVLGQVLFALTLAVPVNSIFAFGEEFGWRGYLLPRLVTSLGFWPGVMAHGAIWGLWHAPLILLIGYNYPGHNVVGVPMFIVFCTLAGVLLAWLQLASGSILAPTVAHASLNAIAGLPLLVMVGVDPAIAGALHSPAGWIVLITTIVLILRREGFARRDPTVAARRAEPAGR